MPVDLQLLQTGSLLDIELVNRQIPNGRQSRGQSSGIYCLFIDCRAARLAENARL